VICAMNEVPSGKRQVASGKWQVMSSKQLGGLARSET
jgi:hypothetical protein